jgi:hypothetical protein
VLEDCKEAVNLLANLEGIGSLGRRSASCLTANVQEDGSGLVVPIFVVNPVSLSKVPLVEKVEVIKELSKVILLEVLHTHLIIYSSICHCGKSSRH